MKEPHNDLIYVGGDRELEYLDTKHPLRWPEMLSSELGDDEWEIIEECGLTHRQKLCFWLYFFEKKSQTQIAEILGINQSSVSRHTKYAKKKVEKYALKTTIR